MDEDFTAGRLQPANPLWRAVLTLTDELSRRHTPELGTRTADVLHVASALELKRRHFLTFDERQARLAVRAGLRLVKV